MSRSDLQSAWGWYHQKRRSYIQWFWVLESVEFDTIQTPKVKSQHRTNTTSVVGRRSKNWNDNLGWIVTVVTPWWFINMSRASRCVATRNWNDMPPPRGRPWSPIYRANTDMDVQKTYTDCHGQSEVGFAACSVLIYCRTLKLLLRKSYTCRSETTLISILISQKFWRAQSHGAWSGSNMIND